MKKVITIVIFSILLCLSNVVGAEDNTIICETNVIDRYVEITGQIPNATGENQVALVLGSLENILYVDQVTSSANGEFKFSFKLPNTSERVGQTVMIGSDVDEGFYQGTIEYGAEMRKFADVDVSVNVSNYVPTLEGTIRCVSGKSMTLNIVNKTDNVTIADETITVDDGIYQLSCQLPSLLQKKIYTVSMTFNDGTQALAGMSVEVDSSVLFVTATGTVEIEEGTLIDARVQTVNTNLVDKNIALMSDQSISATLPNIISNSTYHISAECYGIADEDLSNSTILVTETESCSSAVTVTGQISAGGNQEINGTVKGANNNIIVTSSCVSSVDGTFEMTIEMPASANSGIYTLVLENENVSVPVVNSFLFLAELTSHDILQSQDVRLYNALKKARPNLDTDNNGAITIEELSEISGALDLSNSNLESIDGLQACTGISELYISNNKISDLEPIAGLGNLKALFADNNNISEIVALPEGLEVLNVEKNQITNMECIRFMTGLRILFADDNGVTSVGFLANKPALRYLSFRNNSISDITPLANSSLLVHVDLSNNNITDIGALSGKLYLKDVRLSHNHISDISALPDVLYHNLYVDDNRLSSGAALAFNAINIVY